MEVGVGENLFLLTGCPMHLCCTFLYFIRSHGTELRNVRIYRTEFVGGSVKSEEVLLHNICIVMTKSCRANRGSSIPLS